MRVGSYQVRNNQILPSYKDSILSISIGPQQSIPCKEYAHDFVEDQLFQIRKPVVLSSVESYHQGSGGNHLSNMLTEQGIKSVILLPIHVNEEFSIVVEVASKIKNQLNAINLLKLEPIIPFIQSYARRTHEEFENQVSAIIQRECTSIHPSVEWRFQEEALRVPSSYPTRQTTYFHEITFQKCAPALWTNRHQRFLRCAKRCHSKKGFDATAKPKPWHPDDPWFRKKELPTMSSWCFTSISTSPNWKRLPQQHGTAYPKFFQKELLPLFQHLKETKQSYGPQYLLQEIWPRHPIHFARSP